MNNSTLEGMISSLKSLNPEEPNYAKEFDALVMTITNTYGEDSIPELITVFEDEPPYDELMFTVVHAIESFEHEIYIEKLLQSTPSLCRSSSRWAAILFMRILNSESAKHMLVHQLQLSSVEMKDSIRNLMEQINQLNPMFLAKTIPILVAASVQSDQTSF